MATHSGPHNKHVCRDDICINGSTLPSKIATSIYTNSADDAYKVSEYNKLRLHYIGDDNSTDIHVLQLKM